MILKSIRSKPIFFLISVIFFLLFIIIPLFTVPVQTVELSLPFYFTETWYIGHPFYLKLMAVVFLLLNSFVLINIARELKLFPKHNLLIPVLLLLFSSFFPPIFQFSPLHISLFFILLCVRSFLNLQIAHKINHTLMWSGALLMFSGLIYPLSFIFLLPALFSILLIRPFRIRKILIFMIGFLLPLIYYLAILYVIGNYSELPSISEWAIKIHAGYDFDILLKVCLAVALLIFVLSIFFLLGHTGKIAVRARNFYNIWLIFTFTIMLSYLLPFSNFQHSYMMLLPFISLLVSNYLIQSKKIWYWEIMLIIAAILSFVVNIAN